MILILHNPRCSKSRQACELIKLKEPFEIREYLKNPLSEKEIKDVLKKLNMKAEEIIRTGEPLFKEKFSKKKYTEAEWIKILAKNPILIERPIIIKGDKALVGRPVENINQLLKNT